MTTFKPDFESFLEYKIFDDCPECISCKDNFEDEYCSWVEQLDPEEWIKFANEYAKEVVELEVSLINK